MGRSSNGESKGADQGSRYLFLSLTSPSPRVTLTSARRPPERSPAMPRVRTLASLASSAFLLGTLAVVPFLPAADEAIPGLVMTLRGHKEAVYAIAFTADGKQVVTGSGDSSIKVWQADTGTAFKTFGGANGHTGSGPGARPLAPTAPPSPAAARTTPSRVWDFPTSKPFREFALATDSRSVAVSPDGLRLAGGTDAGVGPRLEHRRRQAAPRTDRPRRRGLRPRLQPQRADHRVGRSRRHPAVLERRRRQVPRRDGRAPRPGVRRRLQHRRLAGLHDRPRRDATLLDPPCPPRRRSR